MTSDYEFRNYETQSDTKLFQEQKRLQGNEDHVGREDSDSSPDPLGCSHDPAPGTTLVTIRVIHSGPIITNRSYTPQTCTLLVRNETEKMLILRNVKLLTLKSLAFTEHGRRARGTITKQRPWSCQV